MVHVPILDTLECLLKNDSVLAEVMEYMVLLAMYKDVPTRRRQGEGIHPV